MMKRENNSSDLFGMIKLCKHIILLFGLIIILIVTAFLIYINKVDTNNYETVDADGVYNLVDSNGNVISTDLTSEDIKKIVEAK